MTRCIPAFLLLTVSFTPLSGQQPTSSHRWRTLVAAPDVRIDLDTASVQPMDHQRRVWLRWTFPTPVPDLADVQLERREVDCRRGQTRILSTEDVGGQQPPRILSTEDVGGQQPPRILSTEDVRGQQPPRVATDSTAVWIRPGPGSLEEQALIAVCRWAEAGA